MDLIDVLRLVAFAGFFTAAAVGNITMIQLLDERRGRRISAFRILLFPYGLDPDAFTERGKRLNARLQITLAFALAFWFAILLLMLFG